MAKFMTKNGVEQDMILELAGKEYNRKSTAAAR